MSDTDSRPEPEALLAEAAKESKYREVHLIEIEKYNEELSE